MSNESATLPPVQLLNGLLLVCIGSWAAGLYKYLQNQNQDESWWVLSITLLAGCVFLGDILCVFWWYTMYIYKIQTTTSLLTYFLDLGVWVDFLVASLTWAVPDNTKAMQDTFLYAAIIGSLLLGIRFYNLYRSHKASNTDRMILRRACKGLILALSICGLAFLIAEPIRAFLSDVLPDTFSPEKGDHHLTLVIILSSIGIGLTYFSKEKIRLSDDIRRANHAQPMPTTMAEDYPSPSHFSETQRSTIMREIDKGIKRFKELFCSPPKYDCLPSQVHPEDDLRFQSYVLSIPSWMPEEKKEKIKFDE